VDLVNTLMRHSRLAAEQHFAVFWVKTDRNNTDADYGDHFLNMEVTLAPLNTKWNGICKQQLACSSNCMCHLGRKVHSIF
jgi:hypothetical protein